MTSCRILCLCSAFSFLVSISSVSGQWTAIGPTAGMLFDMKVFNGQLFVGGTFPMGAGQPGHISAAFDGSGFIYPSSTVTGSAIRAFEEHEGELFAGGGFTGNGMFGIGRWDGTTWVGVSGYNVGNPMPVEALLSHNGSLYVGGNFDTPFSKVAIHNGSAYTAMGEGFNDLVTDLIVYNGSVYACGRFTMSGSTPVSRIARWTGTAWQDVGGGLAGNQNLYPYDMEVFDGELYVAGSFTGAGGASIPHLAKWDGSSWSAVGGGVTSGLNKLKCLLATPEGLYVGGQLLEAGGITMQGIGLWNGNMWSNPGNLPETTEVIFAMEKYNGQMYLAVYNILGAGTSFGRIYRGIAVGIDEQLLDAIEVFPVPSSDVLVIRATHLQNAQFRIYGLDGAELLSGTLKNELDIRDLRTGVYILEIYDRSVAQRIQKRFVKL